MQNLIEAGVEPEKIIIGAAFCARVWENVPNENKGLYKAGNFKVAHPFRSFSENLSEKAGFVFYWHEIAKAPYAYHPAKQLYATFDDKRSVAFKTNNVLQHNLDGIMFWELGSDAYVDGLLQAINDTLSDPGE